MPFTRIAVLLMFLLACSRTLAAGDTNAAATNLVAGFELLDQFDAPRKIAFPATNTLVLIVTDRKGSEQVEGWMAALEKYPHPVTVRGLADLGGAPWFVHGRIRRHFRKTYQQPVMLDWSGKHCARIRYQAGVANVLVIDRDGVILNRVTGAALETNCAAVFGTIEETLAKPPSSPSTASGK